MVKNKNRVLVKLLVLSQNTPRYITEWADYQITGNPHQETSKNASWESKLDEISNNVKNRTKQIEVNPLLLPQNHDEAAQDAARREYIERGGQNHTTNTKEIPINIYVNGAKDPQATAERTVALLRSYKGVYA